MKFIILSLLVSVVLSVDIDMTKMTQRQRMAMVKKVSDVICSDNLDAATKAKALDCEKTAIPVAVNEITSKCVAQQAKGQVTKPQICYYNDNEAVEDCVHELADKAKEKGLPGQEAMELGWKQVYFICVANVAIASVAPEPGL